MIRYLNYILFVNNRWLLCDKGAAILIIKYQIEWVYLKLIIMKLIEIYSRNNSPSFGVKIIIVNKGETTTLILMLAQALGLN